MDDFQEILERSKTSLRRVKKHFTAGDSAGAGLDNEAKALLVLLFEQNRLLCAIVEDLATLNEQNPVSQTEYLETLGRIGGNLISLDSLNGCPCLKATPEAVED